MSTRATAVILTHLLPSKNLCRGVGWGEEGAQEGGVWGVGKGGGWWGGV